MSKCSYKSSIFAKCKKEVLAGLLALLMTATGFFVGNYPYPVWDSIEWFCVAENVVRSIFGETDDKGDAFFVNVGFDKQLVDVQLETFETGHVAITDRKALLDFLNIAEQADYKYIFLDVRFEKGYDTEWDDMLFSKMAKMRNLVFAHHFEPTDTFVNNKEINGIKIADSTILNKASYNDYFTTIFSSNFTRYQYLQNDRPSVALRMYQEIDNKNIEHWGPFYFNNGSLCENCPYIPIKGTINKPIGDGSAPDYLNLGSLLMTIPQEVLIEDIKGKIIVIGDFEEDIHDTYMGKLPGAYLTYLAYKYLARGENNVSILLLFFMTLVYFFIVRSILMDSPAIPWSKKLLQIRLVKWLHRLLSHHFIKTIAYFFSYSLVLSLICTVIFIVWGYTFNVVLPAMIITIIFAIKDIKKIQTT